MQDHYTHPLSLQELAAQTLALYEKALANFIHTIFENSNLAYSLWMELTACALAESSGEHSLVEEASAILIKTILGQI